MDTRLDRCPLGVLEVDPNGTVIDVNDTARRLLRSESNGGGKSDGEVGPAGNADLVGEDIADVFPHSVERTLPRMFEGTPVEDEESDRRSPGSGGDESASGDAADESASDGPAGEVGIDGAEFEEYYPSLDRWLSVTVVPADRSVVVYLDDVTDRRRHEQTADSLEDELARLSVIDTLLADVLAELVDASDREEIAETICDRLGETAIYEFAWLGEREIGGDRIVVRAAAGETGDTLDRVKESLDGPATTPEERAVETGAVQVVGPIADDETVPESVRQAAFADGMQSSLAIPLTYGDSVYGVVGVYAAERDAFSERERASFETLGEMAGFAINASRHRNLLLSDTVTELTFAVGDPSAPLVAVATELGAELSVDGTVLQDQQRLLCYLTVEGTETDDLRAVVADATGVEGVRVVDDQPTGGSLEVELVGDTPLLAFASRGATIRSATYDEGSGRIVVELPADEEIRRIAEGVTRQFDAQLVAKRERERSVTTAREFREELGDRLTDRQESALRTAFFADYFESPRGSTAEEVAAALDITGSTLLHHLRAGERKLLEAYFEPESGRRPRSEGDGSPGAGR